MIMEEIRESDGIIKKYEIFLDKNNLYYETCNGNHFLIKLKDFLAEKEKSNKNTDKGENMFTQCSVARFE